MSAENRKPFRVGVDIGGTFTDLIMVNDDTGDLTIGKTLTTPEDPSIAVERAMREALAQTGVPAGQIQHAIHGTTLVTNIVIERKGSKTALISTQGFRDAIEIRRETRYDMYDLFLEFPRPLVPRYLRLGIRERILDDGSMVQPLDRAEAEKLVRELKARGIEAVAVCLLHSYKNAAHEKLVAEVIREIAPEMRLSLSSEVVPEIKEYERASTTICNAYVQAMAEGYLQELEGRLKRLGFAGELFLFVMLSSGGICTVDTARRFPVRLLESGPTAGALAAAYYGQLMSHPNLLSFDMGGTTAKLCIIEKGQPLTASEFEVGRVYRFKKGSGLPVKVKTIEMIEIGAGGGSIARIDPLGLLKVGPESAGANPGPVCYGLGGEEPTVTDADLLLGYLDPDFFLGGRMKLDPTGAARIVEEKVARPLGLSLVEAAWGIHQIVNENMANAARIHAIERGQDPRAFPLFAFGGAGPVHAYRVGEILHSPQVIMPYGAGVTSTLGFLVAPLAFDFVRSSYARLGEVDWEMVNGLYEEMEEEGRALLRASGVPEAQLTFTRTCDMRYVGQGHEVSVPVPPGKLTPDTYPVVLASFEEVYRQLYGRIGPEVGAEALNWRLSVAGPKPEVRLKRQYMEGVGATASGRPRGLEEALKGHRPVYFPEYRDYRPTPVYDRYKLAPGTSFAGPAIVEERESTAVIGPGGQVSVDEYLNLVVRYKNGR